MAEARLISATHVVDEHDRETGRVGGYRVPGDGLCAIGPPILPFGRRSDTHGLDGEGKERSEEELGEHCDLRVGCGLICVDTLMKGRVVSFVVKSWVVEIKVLRGQDREERAYIKRAWVCFEKGCVGTRTQSEAVRRRDRREKVK